MQIHLQGRDGYNTLGIASSKESKEKALPENIQSIPDKEDDRKSEALLNKGHMPARQNLVEIDFPFTGKVFVYEFMKI